MLYQLARKQKPKDGEERTEPRTWENLRQQVEQMYHGIYTIQGFSQKNLFQADNQVFPALRSMRDIYDYILIDTPPVGTLLDAQQLCGLMGQCDPGGTAGLGTAKCSRGVGGISGEIGDCGDREHYQL